MSFRFALRLVLLALGIVAVSFVLTQTIALVDLAGRLGNVARWTVLTLVVLVYGAAVIALVRWRLGNPALKPVAGVNPAQVERYTRLLARRLRHNPLLPAHTPLQHTGDVDAALAMLSRQADALAEESARRMLEVSAVARHGSLESLMVLVAHARLASRIAAVYWVKPKLSELAGIGRYLVATKLLSAELEESDLTEDARPLITSIIGSMLGSLPGLQSLTAAVAEGLLRGSANAYLSLRVAFIVEQYCGARAVPAADIARERASRRARERLAPLVSATARDLAERMWTEARQAAGKGMASVSTFVRAVSAGAAKRTEG